MGFSGPLISLMFIVMSTAPGQMAQRQLVAALKAATAAGAKIKAAEAWVENPGPEASRNAVWRWRTSGFYFFKLFLMVCNRS